MAEPEAVEQMRDDGVQCPVFFTWYGQRQRAVDFSPGSCELRGCIGTLSPVDPESIGKHTVSLGVCVSSSEVGTVLSFSEAVTCNPDTCGVLVGTCCVTPKQDGL